MSEKRYLLAENTITRAEMDELAEWLKTGPWLTHGPLVKEYEQRFAKWLGTLHACFVNSGSSANLLMYYSALLSGRLKNRKVVVPAVSWATSVAPAIQLGFEPIMCDADPDNFGMDLNALEDILKEHDPGAVLIVHVLGVPCEMDGLQKLKESYGFLLLEDACAATGSRYDDSFVGTFGDMSTFSFFFGHHLSTIEGGMVCTNDQELQNLLLMTRSHGWSKDLAPEVESQMAEERNIEEFSRPFTFYVPGFNVRSSDLNARIGLSQLNKIDYVLSRRIENHAIYQARFLEAEGFHCQSNPRATICSISFVVLAPSKEERLRIAKVLGENNIETRPLGGGNMSRQPFWADRLGPQDFPRADRIAATAFHLPNHPGLSPNDIRFICDTVLS